MQKFPKMLVCGLLGLMAVASTAEAQGRAPKPHPASVTPTCPAEEGSIRVFTRMKDTVSQYWCVEPHSKALKVNANDDWMSVDLKTPYLARGYSLKTEAEQLDQTVVTSSKHIRITKEEPAPPGVEVHYDTITVYRTDTLHLPGRTEYREVETHKIDTVIVDKRSKSCWRSWCTGGAVVVGAILVRECVVSWCVDNIVIHNRNTNTNVPAKDRHPSIGVGFNLSPSKVEKVVSFLFNRRN
ncbi:MAG: hypothetical protein JWN50_776 [Parcubacteria group bacterium]|nr:hypothetical protein [Parcubacteria group bacterium]